MQSDPIAKRYSIRTAFYSGVILTLILLFAGWWAGSNAMFGLPGERLIAVGRLLGLIAAWCIILEIMLMSRVPFMERYFDLQDTVDLHRLNGYGILLGIAGHTAFLVLGYASTIHNGWWIQFIQFNTSYGDVLWATIGTIILFIASGLSVYIMRTKMRYEVWYATHLTVYLAILLTFLHQIKIGGDFIGHFWFAAYWYALYILAFVLWAWYRVLRPFALLAKHQFKVVAIDKTAKNTYSVTLSGNNIKQFDFESGQYATWRFLSSSLWFEAHPFSISSSPGQSTIRLTVKASPSLTYKIASLKLGTYVMIDGPRGSFTLDRVADSSAVIMIAGGIGITPYMSSIKSLLDDGKDITLLYAVRSTEDIAFSQELRQLQERGLKVQTFVDELNQQITPGILGSMIKKDTTVYVCGPDGMSKAFSQILKNLGVPKGRIVTERFAF